MSRPYLLKLQQQNPSSAQTLLEEALRTTDDLRVFWALARCFIAEKRIPAGTQKFREYAAQRPNSPWTQQGLGGWLVLTGDAEGARKAFAGAKAADANFSPADLMLVQIEVAEGKLVAARETLLRVLARDKRNVKALLLLGALEI